MQNLPAAMILSNRATCRLARSAEPDAPVAPRPAPRRVVGARPRATIARGLERLAAAVAPPAVACPPACCTPAS